MPSSLFTRSCLIGAGISFLTMAIVCTLLYPEIFQHYEYGVSYFGSVSTTFIPYYLGFGLTITFVVLIARCLWSISKPLSIAFYAFAFCMAGVAITSYSLNDTVYAIHWAFAIALTVCILTTIFWLLKQGGLGLIDYILICLIVITVAISSLPVIHNVPVVKVYIPRELLVFACSLWLLGRAALKVSKTKPLPSLNAPAHNHH